jgi:putative flavoprotein involved in K+ transport
MERVGVLVIGGGPAGLAVSHELSVAGVAHVLVERGRVGQAWRDRWDSFCLVTPNWSIRLPGGAYDGDDPDGFLLRDEVVAHLERYAARFDAPVREGVAVRSLAPAPTGGFVADTTAGVLHADRVVVCTGAFQRPHLPAQAAALPAGLPRLDLTGYTGPSALRPGPVLVVGSGQSGSQLAEELVEAGREVVLSCGRAPWVQRRIGDHDQFWWAVESGFVDQPVAALPSPAARLGANVLSTGHGGGHDLSLRTLRAKGVTLAGRFLGADGGTALFASDLAATVAWGDDRYREIRALYRRTAAERGWPEPPMPDPEPFDAEGPRRVEVGGFGAAIFTGGFRPDYRSWMAWPEAFDDLGFPVQADGRSTVVDGLFFVGVHFMRTRKSSILLGMGEDAAIVASAIAAGPGPAHAAPPSATVRPGDHGRHLA